LGNIEGLRKRVASFFVVAAACVNFCKDRDFHGDLKIFPQNLLSSGALVWGVAEF
jgi:hypothetical protein